ncbi:spermatogenesis-defective protein 39 [Ditylenchus destructor]|uniref:Spermatogenesis-defective protein 39 n=1 Tax=Ditylenchus destructor TaxID=166010 RepID=A0AAD4MSR4_9BILA|nr:spermatogenesis-defective protein 39 [Ditylenchus destructor]
MHIHRRFNFDDPEDSYWNETGNNTGNQASDLSQSESSRKQSVLSKTSHASFFDNSDLESGGEDLSTTPNRSRLLEEFESKINLPGPSTWKDAADAITTDPSDSKSVQSDKSSVADITKPNSSSKVKPASASIVSDCSLGSYSTDVTVQLDYSRLKSEHKKLQKHFENIRKERYNPLPVYEAVKRLRQCQPVSLDLYKSKQDKLNLLEAALDTCDHDVICVVVLFLKRTLANSIFREILIMKEIAAEHYVQYLRESGDHSELCDTLFALGRCEEAAMFKLVSEAYRVLSDEKLRQIYDTQGKEGLRDHETITKFGWIGGKLQSFMEFVRKQKAENPNLPELKHCPFEGSCQVSLTEGCQFCNQLPNSQKSIENGNVHPEGCSCLQCETLEKKE